MSVKPAPNDEGAYYDFLRDQIACIRFTVSAQVVQCKLITIDGDVFRGHQILPLNKAISPQSLKRAAYQKAFNRFSASRLRFLGLLESE